MLHNLVNDLLFMEIFIAYTKNFNVFAVLYRGQYQTNSSSCDHLEKSRP